MITPVKISARGWKTHTVMVIHNYKIEDNDVNETGYEGLSSGSDGLPGQAPLGRQPATGRRKLNTEVNRVVMECYFESEATARGYRKKMPSAWKKREMVKVSEQNLADQVRAIKTNKWLSEVELEEIKWQGRGSIGDTDSEIENVIERSDEPPEDTSGREVGGTRAGAFRIVNSEGLSEKQIDILEEIKVAIEEGRGEELRPLKHVERTKLREATQEINVLIAHVETIDITDITEINQLLRAAAIVVTRKLDIKRATNHPRKEPFWKRRMKSKIQVLRGEISKLERSRSNPSLKLRGLIDLSLIHI